MVEKGERNFKFFIMLESHFLAKSRFLSEIFEIRVIRMFAVYEKVIHVGTRRDGCGQAEHRGSWRVDVLIVYVFTSQRGSPQITRVEPNK